MDEKKKVDGLMKFTVAVYLLVLLGFIEMAAAAYLLFLVGWLVKEMYRGFCIGQIERQEYKERACAWQNSLAPKVAKKDARLKLAGASSK